jgi:hypothetical protein
MPTRKLSEEIVSGTIADTDLMLITRDPAGVPLTRAVEYSTVKANVLASMPPAVTLPVPVTPADFLPYTLPNGGSVLSSVMAVIPGETIGSVEDILQVTVTNPTVPGSGPVIIFYELDLSGGIPASSHLRLSGIPGAVPTDFQYGVAYNTTAAGGAALYLIHSRDATPPATRTLQIAEFDPLSGSPASWESPTLTYVVGELMDVHLRHVAPFAASPNVPQFYFDVELYTYQTPAESQRYLFGSVNADVGVFNDSGAWDGGSFDQHGFFILFSSSYVGSVTLLFTLAKNY